MSKIAAGRSPSKKPLFQAIEDVCDAFCKWDNFLYQPALKMLQQAAGKLRGICSASLDPNLLAFANSLAQSLPVLETVCTDMQVFTQAREPGSLGNGTDGIAIIKDLVANAVRRAEIEHKHDDAVARLYSAIEKHAKLRLKAAHGINNSNVDLALVKDDSFREMLKKEYSCVRDGVEVIQVPLHKSYELLMVNGDEVGRAYAHCSDELAKVLAIRNMSLLTHGFAPVTETTYKGMLDIALDFLGIRKSELPAFARMGWEDREL